MSDEETAQESEGNGTREVIKHIYEWIEAYLPPEKRSDDEYIALALLLLMKNITSTIVQGVFTGVLNEISTISKESGEYIDLVAIVDRLKLLEISLLES